VTYEFSFGPWHSNKNLNSHKIQIKFFTSFTINRSLEENVFVFADKNYRDIPRDTASIFIIDIKPIRIAMG
jgi:hypothetical protein